MNTMNSINSALCKCNPNDLSINTIVTPVIYDNKYYVYTFTDPLLSYDISFTNVRGKVPLNILIVGGGGGGGSGTNGRQGHGGGGGGGVGIGYYDITSDCNFTINVGAGGISNYAYVNVGGDAGETPANSLTASQVSPGFNGGNSIIKQNNNIIMNAYGGGYGGAIWNSSVYILASDGGSGGGGLSQIFITRPPGNATTGTGYLTYYGNRGGLILDYNGGAGGGGAGEPGHDISSDGIGSLATDFGYGGNGYTVNTTLYPGIPLNTYGGGGAGGHNAFDVNGGSGGGGKSYAFSASDAGTDGLGGGGGGGGKINTSITTTNVATGGRGGNGVVIISIPIINVR